MEPNTTIGPYGRLALFAFRRRWFVLAVFAVLTVIGGVLGLPPRIDNNVMSMLPPDNPVVAASAKLQASGGVDLLVIGLHDPNLLPLGDGEQQDGDKPTSEALEAYTAALAERLKASPNTEFVLHEIDPDLAYRVGLLQLEAEDVNKLNQRLRGALAMGPALNPLVIQRLMDMGETTGRLAKARDVSLFEGTAGTSRIVVRPIKGAYDRDFVMAFYDEVQEIIAADPPEAHGLTIAWMGGSYRHVPEDIRTLTSDLGWTSGVSAVLVLFIIALAFRDVRATVIVFVPIVCSNIITLGMVGVSIGHLNTFTAAAVPVLIGLGIDFGVHLYGRYREYFSSGMDRETALATAWDKTGPPCMTAGLTSAAGFLALSAANFRGFSQFGLVLAFGLITCLVSMLFLVPVLVSFIDPKAGRALPGAKLGEAKPSTSTYRLAPAGLMVAVMATTVIAAILLPRLQFDFDISSMRGEGLAFDELSDVEREIAEDAYSPVVLSFTTREKMAEAQELLNRRIKDHEQPFVASTLSVENVLPSDMGERIAALDTLAKLVKNPNLRYLHASPARPMIEALMPLRTMEVTPLSEDELPNGLLQLMGGGSDAHRLMVLPTGNIWDMRNSLKMSDELTQAVPHAEIAGSGVLQGQLFSMVSRDMPLVGGLALFLVCALAAIDMYLQPGESSRKPFWFVAAMGSLLAGLAWAGIMLQVAGVRLSVVNVVGVPILLGIGVDVVIHLLHRLKEEGPGGVRRAWRTTGVAALVSTATTVASFGALMLAESRGIRSLGLLVVVGLTTITLVGAMLLPLAWAAGWKVAGRAPADQ